ncbi:hypothetical protein E1B28_012853 [Marasmius oreades]|uniref:Glycoside hydrolase 131 catalytic N-terminal domain-containing protein n=1 Tax=Marasmius oreades TaxID=181124 RepID=A0A9P7UP52_9AGAR|nr:uncharacterized protein E1B28_012853 [Marasmius oreades]KAG7088908.1 hypothetical protein E1B28_012853 [Marasmius oreades]
MKLLLSFVLLGALHQWAAANKILFDGRIPLWTKNETLDASADPFLTAVKGRSYPATHYSGFLGKHFHPTPLWNGSPEQVISIRIDNTSVFIPGNGTGVPQSGFRRTELIAQRNGSASNADRVMESGVTRFHFSIKADQRWPLNYTHEYQVVFIEPSDGSHVFGIQLGSPFTNPTGILPAPYARWFKVLDHNLNVLFKTPFTTDVWHNFAIRVDWENRTLQVLYSIESRRLASVTEVVSNPTVPLGDAGKGDFHVGLLKLPLVNPADSPANQGDVVHYGLQEGTVEGLLYSGIFVERIS